MKKIISLILAALLAFAGIALADEDFTGTWYLTSVNYEGIEVDPSVLGIEMSVTLNEDGTAAFLAMGEENACIWAQLGDTVTLAVEDETMTLTFDGTALAGELEGTAVKFTRETVTKEAEAAEVYAEDIAAFDGVWAPTKFVFAGITVDAQTLAMFGVDISELDAITFTISNGAVEFSGETIQFSLVDGLLFAELPEVEGSFRIQLLESGEIQVDMPILPVTMICERAEEALLAA